MALEISAKRVLPFYIPVDADCRDVQQDFHQKAPQRSL